MRIESVRISNFRSLRDVEVTLDDMTVLIGANSSGKTSVLEAIRMFGDGHDSISKADFFPDATTIEIEMTIDAGKSHDIPREYLVDGKVTLQKVAELGDGDRVVELSLVKKMCIGDLVGVRNLRLAKDRQAEMRKMREKYQGLPQKGAWPGTLNAYEHERLDDPRCEYVPHFVDLDQSEFRSRKLVDIMYVPVAMDMEANAEDSRGSLLADLIEETIRGAGAHDAKLKKIADEANRKARRLMRSVNRDGDRLAGKMGEQALPYADGLEFRLEFSIPELQNARPRATLTLVEDGLAIPMDRAGSGAQRVYLMALLETIYYLGDEEGEQEGEQEGEGAKARIMLIDEPELYQHPQRQGRMLRALGGLAGDSKVQVACSTHSPYFVWLEDIGRIRRLQKVGRETAICQTTMARIADSVNQTNISRDQVGEVRMAALLDMVSSRWIAEGLFARLVVLVEGPGDRSMLLATARAMKVSLDELEVAIVPCGGKPGMPHVLQVFRHLGVPVYLVWDVDPECKDEYNRRLNLGLQKLAGHGETDGLDPMKLGFGPRHSCPTPNLSDVTIRRVERPGMLLTERMGCHGLNVRKKKERKKAIQNQRIMYEILEAVKGNRRKFGSLPTVRIIRQVERMRMDMPDRRRPGRRRRPPTPRR